VANIVDPLGGSHAVEALTDAIESAALHYIEEIDRRGGMVKAIAEGYPQLEIAEAAYREQRKFDSGERTIVGVNRFVVPEELPVNTLRIPLEVEERQAEKVRAFKRSRSVATVRHALATVRDTARSSENLMPALVAAVKDGCTVGEISDVYREVFGEYRDPAYI
jgi:methylmalonyl-CoA mutase N-terminal domain/subunit